MYCCVVKLAAVKVKSLDEIKVEKEKPSATDQQKDNDEVSFNTRVTHMHAHTCMRTHITLSILCMWTKHVHK